MEAALRALVSQDILLQDLVNSPLSLADVEALVAKEQGSALSLTLAKADGSSIGTIALHSDSRADVLTGITVKQSATVQDLKAAIERIESRRHASRRIGWCAPLLFSVCASDPWPPGGTFGVGTCSAAAGPSSSTAMRASPTITWPTTRLCSLCVGRCSAATASQSRRVTEHEKKQDHRQKDLESHAP